MPSCKTKKLVEVQWVDADAEAGWFKDDPKSDKPVVLRTFGLLVRKTKDWVILASTYDHVNEQWSDRGRIPRGMVQEIRIIETVRYK